MMKTRSGAVTMKGAPLTLVGPELKVGDEAPDFTVVDNDLKTVRPTDFKGVPLVICSVPSLDTPVCDLETRRFNAEAAKLKGARILTISMDLPFAQKRWCGAHGIEAVKTLSDHRDASFGRNYGVLIEELRLLARAVFIVGPKGKLQYIQIVREVSDEPDYEAVLNAARSVR
jgi:thiol peroxidase